jgi:hypothetical protein
VNGNNLFLPHTPRQGAGGSLFVVFSGLIHQPDGPDEFRNEKIQSLLEERIVFTAGMDNLIISTFTGISNNPVQGGAFHG